jgi:hypothetical protein
LSPPDTRELFSPLKTEVQIPSPSPTEKVSSRKARLLVMFKEATGTDCENYTKHVRCVEKNLEILNVTAVRMGTYD